MSLEWLLIVVLAALGSWLLGLGQRRAGWLAFAMLLVGLAVSALASRESASAPRPIALGRPEFVSSSACRSCHPAEHASWHDSYHRTMTQGALLSAAASPLLRAGGRLRAATGGRSLEIWSRGAELWASMPDPSVTSSVPSAEYARAFASAPLRDVRIELLTGSHRHQVFWVAARRGGELQALPVVYVIDEARLIPRREAFLNPPEAGEPVVRWNSNCVQCHSVAGAPAHDEQRDVFETSAAELGIACEACHGAGAAHVSAMKNPLARFMARAKGASAEHIVNPAKLSSERASQVCGRCHSYFFPKDEADWWKQGFARSYAPGQELGRAQLLLSPDTLAAPGAPELGASVESMFYGDGTIRVGGREYNGLVRSPCYERGQGEKKLSCLSCHSMHDARPDDQLKAEALDNRACSSCHAAQGSNVAGHSHHSPSSAGSRCYNCHMPHVSYALLGAIRSHRIDSPAFDARREDKPNACNLCHLEQSEAWAAKQVAAWFGAKPSFELSRAPEIAEGDPPSAAVFALAGDAAVRAITAAALGRHQSSKDAPQLRQQLLGHLARDEYAAVRQIAERSRESQQGSSEPAALPDGLVERLLAARSHHPVTIAE